MWGQCENDFRVQLTLCSLDFYNRLSSPFSICFSTPADSPQIKNSDRREDGVPVERQPHPAFPLLGQCSSSPCGLPYSALPHTWSPGLLSLRPCSSV